MTDSIEQDDADALRRAEAAIRARPKTFQALHTLCFGATHEDVFYVDFVLEVHEISTKYKTWARGKAKQKEIAELADALRSIDEPVAAFNHVWQRLDEAHAEIWKACFSGVAPALSAAIEGGSLRLDDTPLARSLMIETFRIATASFATGDKGRPMSPYTFPAMDLMTLWNEWHPKPKNRKHGLLQQAKWPLFPTARIPPRSQKGQRGKQIANAAVASRSAEFVHVGLQIIDPKVTAQTAVTSINQARKMIKRSTQARMRTRSLSGAMLRLMRSASSKKKRI